MCDTCGCKGAEEIEEVIKLNKSKQIYQQLDDFLSQFKTIRIKGSPYIVFKDWGNYYEVYPLNDFIRMLNAFTLTKHWENDELKEGYAPQKIVQKEGRGGNRKMRFYDMKVGGWVEEDAWNYDAEGFDAENEDFEFEYHVYVSDSPTDDIFIVDDARDFGTQEGAIKAAHEVSKDKRGKGKMVYVVAEEREMEIEQVIYTIDEDGDVLNAETFDAENLSFKERIEKMIDVASPKFEGIKGLGKRIGAKQGKKLDYKIQGILPKAKGVSSYRRNIETPKWYKGIQLGIMTGLAGFITYKLATETPKEE
tara:strand:- start:2038 stop:2958 length:921 start_codon:yes stop_codon:yes gene_type:complete